MKRQTAGVRTVCLVYKDLRATKSPRDVSVRGGSNAIIKFLICFLGMDAFSASCAPGLCLILTKLASNASCCLLVAGRGVCVIPMVATPPSLGAMVRVFNYSLSICSSRHRCFDSHNGKRFVLSPWGSLAGKVRRLCVWNNHLSFTAGE